MLTGRVRLGMYAMLFAALLALQLPLSMWHDEAWTYVMWIDGWRPSDLLAPYHSNNHRLFTLLAVAAGRAGGRTDVVLRLPSVIPAVLALTLLARTVSQHRAVRMPLLPVALFASSPIVLYWASQARGYGLILLAATLLSTSVLRIHLEQIDRTAIAMLVASAVIGVWTLPHFLVTWGLTVLVLAVQQRERLREGLRRGRTVVFVVAGLALPLAAYLPTAARLFRAALSGGPSRNPSIELPDVIWGHFRFLVVGTLEDAGAVLIERPAVLVVVGSIGVLYVAALTSLLVTDRRLLGLLVLPGHAFFLVAWGLGWRLTDRNVLFLLPAFVITFGFVDVRAIASALAGSASMRRALESVGRGVGMLTLAISLVLPVHASVVVIGWSQQPIEAFRETATIVRGAGVETIISDSRRPFGIQRYLPEVLLTDDEITTRTHVCDAEAPFAFIDHDHIREWPAPTDCLAERGGVSVQLEQRRRGSIRVWIVPEPSS